MAGPTVGFWQEKFDAGQTLWDRGQPNPQLAAWLDAGVLAPCRIAVPGCGAGYEVVELAGRGFRVTGLDYTPAAVQQARQRVDALPPAQRANARVLQADVLAWQPDEPLDAVYEQACLCALHPDLWTAYAAALARWLPAGGRLFALFVQVARPGAAEGRIEGPPYHCDINGMRALFPDATWEWPKPPYPRLAHPAGIAELPVVLVRR